MEQSVKDKILKRMRKNKRGKIFFVKDFITFGDYESCKKALIRLEKQGEIMRLGRGIYTIPQTNEFIGDVAPSVNEIVRTIMKRDGAKVVPTGLFALNMLNLSTQVPAKSVFLTDGNPRKFKIGKVSVILKKTSPRNVATKGEISTLAIQALKSIGKDNATDKQIKKIVDILKKENPKHLEYDIVFAPIWIQKIMRKALTN